MKKQPAKKAVSKKPVSKKPEPVCDGQDDKPQCDHKQVVLVFSEPPSLENLVIRKKLLEQSKTEIEQDLDKLRRLHSRISFELEQENRRINFVSEQNISNAYRALDAAVKNTDIPMPVCSTCAG